MSDDQDLLLLWAAEELLAAGRANDAAGKATHRRNGVFFADIGQSLQFHLPAEGPKPTALGELLTIAFAIPPAAQRRRIR